MSIPANRPARGGITVAILLLACHRPQAEDTPSAPVLGLPMPVPQGWQIPSSPYPAAQTYQLLSAPSPAGPFLALPTAVHSNHVWLLPPSSGPAFFQTQVNPISSNDLLAANVLQRLAYGPTPDELDRVRASGPQAYIEEQLAPEAIPDDLDQMSDDSTDWQYVSLTGTATSSTLYIYLNAAGEVYLDDLQLVAGPEPDGDTNVLRNGGFESPLAGSWTVSANLAQSSLSSEIKHSGNSSLRLVATSAGSTQGSSIWQTVSPSLRSGETYTLSYWYLPATNSAQLTLRLSGRGIESTHYIRPGGSSPSALYAKLEDSTASIDDLRAWHTLHAIRSRRQLAEVLAQFLENHFVTQYSKSRDYLDNYYNDSTRIGRLATRMEFQESLRWRAVLEHPQGTFHDLLRISAESPAMIIYLDTVNSKGNGRNIANENYARELLELFTFGVDNGYDGSDIVSMSKTWTGWSVRLVDATNEFNPFALQSTTIIPGSTNTSTTTISNLVGVWAFNFKSANHHTNSKTIFPGKTVPARFGPPWAGRPYQLNLPARSGTNGIRDGYEVLAHLANQPFTQEYLSVKLCRLFVHDDFHHGYDFTDPHLSPEARLVRDCMLAWESSSPRGQLRPVLATIFNSSLFRSHAAASHKVKTPLEFAVSTLRALRTPAAQNLFTADSDGFSLKTPLARMGNMALFDREDPDGYPETAPGWISAGTLAERLRFVQTLVLPLSDTSRNDSISGGNKSFIDPSAVMRQRLPAPAWTDAPSVAALFVSLLFPAEGPANLQSYQTLAEDFLNTADNGLTPSPFRLLTPGSAAADTRLRGLTAMLLTLPRFQEQ